MNETVTYAQLVLALLCIAVPAVVQIVRLTRWGRAHREALDAVSQGLEVAKEAGGKLNATLGHLSQQEAVRPPAVVSAWKAAHRRALTGRPKYQAPG